MHTDFSGQLEQTGVKVTLITAGAHKADGNPFEALPDDVRAEIQADIDVAYSRFVAHVATARGLSEDAVRATEARIYRGEEAVKVGLVDKVMSWSDSQAEFVAIVNGRQPANTQRGRKSGARASMETNMDPAIVLAAAQGLTGITALTVVGTPQQATAIGAALTAIGCSIDVTAVAAAPEATGDVAAARTQANETATAAERTRVLNLASLCPETNMSAGFKTAVESGTSMGDFAVGLAQAAKTRGASMADLRDSAVAADQLPEQRASTATADPSKVKTSAETAKGILGLAATANHPGLAHLKRA
jgi:hypothetical protein